MFKCLIVGINSQKGGELMKNTFKKPLGFKTVALNEKEYSFLDVEGSLGYMALVLPLRRKLTHIDYMLCRENIPYWDNHPDICGIAVYGEEKNLENLLIEKLNTETGYILDSSDLKPLGFCAADRYSNTICKLYTIDLSQYKLKDDFFDESKFNIFWGTDENIVESLDAQLIACYAKIKYLFL